MRSRAWALAAVAALSGDRGRPLLATGLRAFPCAAPRAATAAAARLFAAPPSVQVYADGQDLSEMFDVCEAPKGRLEEVREGWQGAARGVVALSLL